MSALRTATFTIFIRDASNDELEAAAAAFTCTLHRAGMTPHDALRAWHRMDEWERADYDTDAEPDADWWHAMGVARQAVLAALRSAGIDGLRRPFSIEAVASAR